jgi:hypothetical protein
MPYAPQSQFRQRAERIGFEERTPVVVRFPEGSRCSGQLQVVSITGGLLSLRRPIQAGTVGKLMFLTHKGCVLGEAQMLSPVSWDQQPFKFTAFHDDDRYRLQTVIQLRLAKSRQLNELRSWEREQMERFRAW